MSGVWLILLLLLSGLLMGDGMIALLFHRSVGPSVWRNWHPPTWLPLAEVLVGAVALVIAAFLWPYSAFKVPAAVVAAFFVLIAAAASAARVSRVRQR